MTQWFGGVENANEFRQKLRRILLRKDIKSGTLLPSTRQLSLECGLHRNTIARIFHEFELKGMLKINQGKSVRVQKLQRPALKFICLTPLNSMLTQRKHRFYFLDARSGFLQKAEELNCGIDFLEIDNATSMNWGKCDLSILSSYDGVLMAFRTPQYDYLLHTCPIPVVYCMVSTCTCLNLITYNRKEATKSMVEYLIKKGYQRIGLVIYDLYENYNKDKYAGYLEGMFQAGLSVAPEFVLDMGNDLDYSEISAYLENYVNTKQLLEAYICTGSNQATILLSFLREKGIKVPDEVAVIGFDEITSRENITQVVLPRRRVAERCLEWLCENAGQNPCGIIEELNVEFHAGTTG